MLASPISDLIRMSLKTPFKTPKEKRGTVALQKARVGEVSLQSNFLGFAFQKSRKTCPNLGHPLNHQKTMSLLPENQAFWRKKT